MDFATRTKAGELWLLCSCAGHKPILVYIKGKNMKSTFYAIGTYIVHVHRASGDVTPGSQGKEIDTLSAANATASNRALPGSSCALG